MKIENLKDLKALIKLCRQTGIQVIKVDGIELALGTAPLVIKRTRAPRASDMIWPDGEKDSDNTLIETPDILTDDQLLFYSADGAN